MCNMYSTAMDVSLKKTFLVAYWSSRSKAQVCQHIPCGTFPIISLRITDTVSYGTGNILVVAWLFLCVTCAEGGGREGGRRGEGGGGRGEALHHNCTNKSHVALRGKAKTIQMLSNYAINTLCIYVCT